jgi:uncharacterized protein YdeI (YjbR/CyaY-like superfamily)
MKNYEPQTTASSRSEWRNWLQKHHDSYTFVWLEIYKKESGIPSVTYKEAVDEALCFGWIDSKPNKKDSKSYYQFFAKRNPKSNWSKVNKEKVEILIAQGLMTSAGMKMIELAKENGTWNFLDQVETLELPIDMEQLFGQNPKAFENWNTFSKSAKRGILEWIANAKTPQTRGKRIQETVELAGQNLKANHPEGQKKNKAKQS